MTKPLRAVALMGATGTGKSSLAMNLSLASGTSIVSCDSMQVYRGLDIGTAKPTQVERQQVPHYLIDCCDLQYSESFSAAQWADKARLVIAAENRQGRTPLIVGGTGLYLHALLEGFADIPEVDAAVRLRIEAWQAAHGTPWLHERLQQCDPLTAARLTPHDSQRIMRALAVYESSGRALSAWHADGRQAAENIVCPVFVLTIERDILRQRIAERFHAMMDAGWLDEARWLDSLRLSEKHPAMRAVGYRQLLDHLHGEHELAEAVEKGITATRKYAKRQVTWFKHQAPAAVFGDTAQLMPQLSEALD